VQPEVALHILSVHCSKDLSKNVVTKHNSVLGKSTGYRHITGAVSRKNLFAGQRGDCVLL
jgi:hypothetical protein